MDILACSLVRMVFHGAMRKQTLRLPKIPTNTRNPKPQSRREAQSHGEAQALDACEGSRSNQGHLGCAGARRKRPRPKRDQASTSGFSVHVVGVQLLANTVLLASLPRCVAVVKFTKDLK